MFTTPMSHDIFAVDIVLETGKING